MVKQITIMTTDQKNNYDADSLLMTFIEYANNEGMMSDIGLEEMTRLFDEVDIERRADVFLLFLKKLDDRNIYYDKSQFNY